MKSLCQKIALIVFGLVLACLILEGALRLSGYVLTLPKKNEIAQKALRKSDYTILCLGESTTDGQWPPFLEKSLARLVPDRHITVIDEGKRCLNTGVIISEIEKNLELYNPDIVISMMGINDWDDTIAYQNTFQDRVSLFLQDFRLYKLAKLVWFHCVYFFTGESLVYAYESVPLSPRTLDEYNDILDQGLVLMKTNDLQGAHTYIRSAIDAFPYEAEGYIRQAWVFQEEGRKDDAETSFARAYQLKSSDVRICIEYISFLMREEKIYEAKQVIDAVYGIAPHDPRVLREYGKILYATKDYVHAKERLFEALIFNQEDHDVYMLIGRVLCAEALYKEALPYFEKGCAIMPENIDFGIEHANTYISLGEIARAKEILYALEKQDSSNPLVYKQLSKCFELEDDTATALFILEDAYNKNKNKIEIIQELARFLLHNKKYARVEALLMDALENPEMQDKKKRRVLYELLGRTYVIQDKEEYVEALYQKAISEFPDDDRFYASLALFYLNRGDHNKAKRHFKAAHTMRMHYVNAVTEYNYTKHKELLHERNIQLVCVQYPMRSVEPLQRMLKFDSRIIFVDNENIFKEQVLSEGYSTFFKDNFAGDFGHCTERGNMLLAENIARTLLAKYFKH
jgi:Tfp pilus assembly protein PilF